MQPAKVSTPKGHKDRVYRALCQALAGHPDEASWNTFSAAEWGELAEIARAEGVASLLYHILKGAGWPEAMPARHREALQATHHACAARNLLAYGELTRILGALTGGNGGPVVVLKGMALAATVYSTVALRPFADVDLLLPRRQIDQAVDVLQGSLGYRRAYPEMAPGLNRRVNYHAALRGGPGAGLLLELHWSLVAGDADWRSPSLDWFWAQTEELQLPDTHPGTPSCALQLSPTAHLLYLGAHLALQHGGAGARLLWYYDLHLLITREEERLDWEELLRRARQFRWAPAVGAALRGTCERFATSFPAGVLDGLAAVSDPRAAHFVAGKAGPLQTRALGSWRYVASLDWRARWRLALGLLCPTPTYVRWRYDPHPRWLWPLYYPYRWLNFLRDALLTVRQALKPR